MSDDHLKSYAFRREREQTWRELGDLVLKVEKKGIGVLTPEQMHRLPTLYRATVSSLSVARSISLDRNLLEFLENLSQRAYLILYGARGRPGRSVAEFLGIGFPSAVRQAIWYILASGLLFAAGAIVAYFLTLAQPDWFYSFVSDGMAGGRSPAASTESLREVLYPTDLDAKAALHLFASFLFTHNAGIAILAFALGAALGVPVVMLMFYNGLTLGAFAALHAERGLSYDFWGWILIHGTTELTAVILCGGAGLMLGGAVILPGTLSRMDNLAIQGRVAARLVIGAVMMLFIAGFLEGFARQLITSPELRYAVGGLAMMGWIAYFTFSGRGGDQRDGD